MSERLIRKQFSARLRALRNKASLSQDQLAERAGISIQAVAAFEQGERFPRAETLASLAGALHVEAGALFAGGDRVAEPPGPPFARAGFVRSPERAQLLAALWRLLEKAPLAHLRLLRRILAALAEKEDLDGR